MRDYRNELKSKKNATYENFEFDIYKINKLEEWKKIKTVKLINYAKKFYSSGSGGINIYHKKNGQELDLCTIETYDIIMKPEKYGTYVEDKSIAFKKNYITLETLNTIDLIADREDWEMYYGYGSSNKT